MLLLNNDEFLERINLFTKILAFIEKLNRQSATKANKLAILDSLLENTHLNDKQKSLFKVLLK